MILKIKKYLIANIIKNVHDCITVLHVYVVNYTLLTYNVSMSLTNLIIIFSLIKNQINNENINIIYYYW